MVTLCHSHLTPLPSAKTDISAINARLDAVAGLMSLSEEVHEARLCMKKFADLERLLSRIHTMGLKSDSASSRAIMYEQMTYSTRKIRDFIAALNGFKLATFVLVGFVSLSAVSGFFIFSPIVLV